MRCSVLIVNFQEWRMTVLGSWDLPRPRLEAPLLRGLVSVVRSDGTEDGVWWPRHHLGTPTLAINRADKRPEDDRRIVIWRRLRNCDCNSQTNKQ